MSNKNIELLLESAKESINYLESVASSNKISEKLRDLLKADLQIIKDLLLIQSSGITSPGMYLMFTNNTSGVAHRIGTIEATIISELSNSEIEFVKKILIATKIVLCYMDAKSIHSF